MNYNGLEVENFKNYYDVSYESTFPLGNYYTDRYNIFPSTYIFSDQTFRESVVNTVAALPGYSLIFEKREDRCSNSELFFENEDEKILIEITENERIEKNSYRVRIHHPVGVDVSGLIKQVSTVKTRIVKKGTITLIKSSERGLETVDFEIKSQIKSLELGYGKDFQKVHDLILEKLNEHKSKGLILLHGNPGTGKSMYLKHLATLLKKKVLWLPQTAADSLCSPDFITFLMENTNSILIIEDGERVIKSRETHEGSDIAVSNLLNLTDGILSDCLHIQVVATFNTDIKNIDKALMRKGRLIVDYEFGNLSVNDTNRLLKHLKIEHESDKEMCLADIYNYNAVDLSNKKQRAKIGFK